MILYTEAEGQYFQKLPFTMKRKTLLRILNKARNSQRQFRRLTEQDSYFRSKIYPVVILINGELYTVASVLFSNFTRWDYMSGRNETQSEPFYKTHKQYRKKMWKRNKQIPTDQYILERQQEASAELKKALEIGWETKVTV